MYNSAFEGELYKGRNQSFRTAVRASKKNQRYKEYEIDSQDSGSRNTAVAKGWTKYNWKRFFPWAPSAKRYVCRRKEYKPPMFRLSNFIYAY